MRVLFTSIRDTGHFLPLVPFIQACRERGHAVAVASPPELAERVAGTGAEFLPFGHPGDEGMLPYWAKLREVAPQDINRVVVGEIFAGVCAKHALPQLLATIEQWKPSIVVRESQEYASVIASEKLGVARARVSIMMRSVERELVANAASSVDAHAQGVGLPSDASGERMLREPSLSLFPPSFDFSENEQASVKRFRAPRRPAQPLPAWWSDQEKPLVYVTLGTVTGRLDEDKAVYRTLLEAVGVLPMRVLFTIGRELALEALGDVPANVHIERFVPQEDVLPHAAAVVCHGGAGTVVGTLAAGVPMVVTPLFADQPQNAARVQATGAGIGLPTRGASVDDIRGALSRVLAEPAYRSAAQRIATEIAALAPIDDAPVELERMATAHAHAKLGRS
jgi:UDP:flavonoid glycosyltransferase YjiC (YdhE family)